MSNLDKILQVLHKNENEIILLLFTADWCKPCKQLKERLSNEDDEYAKQLLNLKMYIRENIIKKFNDIEKYLFGLRERDSFQKEKSVGPGEKYKKYSKKTKRRWSFL